jgi:Fic family protein
MEALLGKINRLVAELAALQPMSEEQRKKLEKKIRLEFNYNSNHLEGNTLTYGETELLLIFDQTQGDHTHREYEEMKAHDMAYQLVQAWANDPRPLTEAEVKSLNEILLVRPFWKDAVTPDGQATRREITVGEYKQFPNSVRLPNGEMFEYASPTETPAKMQELMEWYRKNEADDSVDALLLAAMLHYRFVRIHPFDDGNGRVSRLLMNYALLRRGLPPVIIKSADKPNYLRALNQADVGDEAAFVRYIGEQLVWSLELSIKAAKGENLEEPDDLDKELAVLQKSLSGQNALQTARTSEGVVGVFKESLIPLYQFIESKLMVLSSSFFQTERNIIPYALDSVAALTLTQTEDDWQILTTWAELQIGQLGKRMQHVTYLFELRGLKTNINARTFQVSIRTDFSDYNYTIQDQPYPYGQPLTQAQIEDIARPIIKNIIEQIKNASQQA